MNINDENDEFYMDFKVMEIEDDILDEYEYYLFADFDQFEYEYYNYDDTDNAMSDYQNYYSEYDEEDYRIHCSSCHFSTMTFFSTMDNSEFEANALNWRHLDDFDAWIDTFKHETAEKRSVIKYYRMKSTQRQCHVFRLWVLH